jgi:hypothetical protein
LGEGGASVGPDSVDECKNVALGCAMYAYVQ